MADDSLLNDSNLATLGSNDDEAELLIEVSAVSNEFIPSFQL